MTWRRKELDRRQIWYWTNSVGILESQDRKNWYNGTWQHPCQQILAGIIAGMFIKLCISMTTIMQVMKSLLLNRLAITKSNDSHFNQSSDNDCTIRRWPGVWNFDILWYPEVWSLFKINQTYGFVLKCLIDSIMVLFLKRWNASPGWCIWSTQMPAL